MSVSGSVLAVRFVTVGRCPRSLGMWSSTRARARWPRSTWAMSSLAWSVRIAWKRCPSMSVNVSWAPGSARSRRASSRDPAVRSRRSVISVTCPLGRLPPSWSIAVTQSSSGIFRIATRIVSVRS